MSGKYFAPTGGHPGQDQLLTDRAIFTDAYAVIPKGTMRDIVTSYLPFWENTRALGYRPSDDRLCRDFLAIYYGGGSRWRLGSARNRRGGRGRALCGRRHSDADGRGRNAQMVPGGYAYLPPASGWTLRNNDRRNAAVSLDPQGI